MSNLHDISREDLESIEMFLDGSLSPEASFAFQKRMEKSEILRNTVSEFKQIFRDVEGAILKDKLQEFHERMLLQVKEPPQANPQNPKRLHYLRYAAVASVILIVAIAGIWFLSQPSEHEKLFATYFTPDPGLITPMSSQNDYLFFDAMVDYKRGEYPRAIEKWEKLFKQKQSNDTLNYFIGVSHLANGNAKSAIPYLKTATTFSQSIFIEDAYYYLGMAYLKLEDILQAKQVLSTSNHEKSIEVLNRLE